MPHCFTNVKQLFSPFSCIFIYIVLSFVSFQLKYIEKFQIFLVIIKTIQNASVKNFFHKVPFFDPLLILSAEFLQSTTFSDTIDHLCVSGFELGIILSSVGLLIYELSLCCGKKLMIWSRLVVSSLKPV